MKKLTALMLCLMMALTGCSSTSNENSNTNGASEEMVHIGVLQIMKHGSLDQAYEGFKEAMKEEGYVEGENVTYDYQVGTNNTDTLVSMSQKLVADKNDAILAIGTGAAQTLSNETKDIPIIGTAITDYVTAGLADSNENPGHNITGMSDEAPIPNQIALLKQLVPDAKTIGIIYTAHETNSEIQAEQAKKAIEDLGMTCVIKTIADQTAITDTLVSMADEIDGLYIPSDNTIAAAMGAVETVTCDEKIPTVVAVEEMCKDGGLASIGISYYELGKETGHMMAKILRGEAKPESTPIGIMEKTDVYYNANILEKLEMQLPDELKDSAQAVETE